MSRVLHVVGARPNFIKIAPVMRALGRRDDDVEQALVHTGQHYDSELSDQFFRDLELPRPDVNLGVGSGSHAQQTARVMSELEPVLKDQRPDWVFVVGDVNSTLAAALVAAKLGMRVAHVEAGLRSLDRSMPEEVNRLVTDRLSDALFTTEASADENLRREGVDPDIIHFVGNVMIDSLDRLRSRARDLEVPEEMGLDRGRYLVVTLHRPSNVDDPDRLGSILRALVGARERNEVPVVFPMHPRTRTRLGEAGLGPVTEPLRVTAPLGYLKFLGLMDGAGAVLTDSGGIQEETTVLGIPCVTLRPHTERPVTITSGTNRLFDDSLAELPEVIEEALASGRQSSRPPLWDGRAAERIARITVEDLLPGTRGRGSFV